MTLQKQSCSNIPAIGEVSYRFKATLQQYQWQSLSFFFFPFFPLSSISHSFTTHFSSLFFLSSFFLDCFSILVLLLSFCETQIVMQPRLDPNLGPSSPTGFGMFKHVQPHLTQYPFPQKYQNTSISDLDTWSKGQKAVSETMRKKNKRKQGKFFRTCFQVNRYRI